MAINTHDLLQEYILRQLGAPSVSVELTEDQIADCINTSIQQFTEFAYDGELEETVVIEVDGSGSYKLPDSIQTIIKVARGGSGSLTNFAGAYGPSLVPDIWSNQYHTGGTTGIINSIIGISTTTAMLDKFFGDDMSFDFSSHKKRLRLFQSYTGPLMIHYTASYTPDAVDYIYDQQWVKKMAVALARLQQSTVVGKYDQALVGGARINYNDMRSLAQEEITLLKEELQSQFAGPAPVMVS